MLAVIFRWRLLFSIGASSFVFSPSGEAVQHAVFGGVVPLEIGLLLESPVADAADVPRRYPALVVEVALQAAPVLVGSAAFRAEVRLQQGIMAP